MFSLDSKYGEVKVYAETIEDEAIAQIVKMANSPLGENAHIRIMPDAHAGAGCTIGTTMLVTDKVCPNILGVDIGCGVDLVYIKEDFSNRLEELDQIIREKIPYGMSVHNKQISGEDFFSENLRCWDKLKKETKELATHSIGTLGGGNHFIEAYIDEENALSVHSGSRNIGYKVAQYYQELAEKRIMQEGKDKFKEVLLTLPPQQREEFIRQYKEKETVDKELCYLTGEDMKDYLNDMYFMQYFATINREKILLTITKEMGLTRLNDIFSIHNYMDNDKVLRKGAIAAHQNQQLVIPLNMRDGILICEGKGNPDWNWSAPHGAGRLYSRSKAKELFSVEEYAEQMKGIFTTCVNEHTLDEAPFVYKDFKEIEKAIEPTVTILKRMKPIYNFKAN